MWLKSLSWIALLWVAPLSLAFNGYQLEVVVFSNLSAQSFNSEHWPTLSSPSYPALSLPAGVEKVGSEAFVLAPEQDRLNHGSYRTLLHAAWRLSYANLNRNTTLSLYGGRLFDEAGHVLQTVQNESYPYSVEQNWELSGRVSLHLDHYFDTRFNLVLAIPKDQVQRFGSSIDQPFLYVPLVENRRLKSQELNYIDHPLYGVLFKITPVL